MNKKMMFIFAIICIILFTIFYYIFYISGNNIIRNQNEFVEDTFKKLENYEAQIKVNVISNKNENMYEMYQTVNNNYSKIVMNYPENIKGLEIEFANNCLKVKKENNMEKIYENYKKGINNSLFLNTFINEYKENDAEIIETEKEIVIRINFSNNAYIESKELYLNKDTGLPIKLLIKDNTKKNNTSIIYNDIKIK